MKTSFSNLEKIVNKILAYVKISNIEIPTTVILEGKQKVIIESHFMNTSIKFKSTKQLGAYEASVQFIEEMNDMYINNNKEFSPFNIENDSIKDSLLLT